LITGIELNLHPYFYLPVWSVHPTILYDPVMFRREGAEQAGGVCGGGQRRHPGVLGTRRPSENMTFRFMFHEDKHAKHALSLKRSWDNDIMSNNDRKWPKKFDNIKDGIEDVNHNGRIDGDNGDGLWGESETWTELNPKSIDTDGDNFSDYNEKQWGYNPLSRDTDGDGLNDNVEDSTNFGIKDSSETSAIKSDTDGDGLTDKMELDGWTVIIIYEATFEIKEEREVYSNPLIADYDEDGINDGGEFENGTDPFNDDTDNDGKKDKEEIDNKYSPTGLGGCPPKITDFNTDYILNKEAQGPFWNLRIVINYQVEIKVSISDFFGLEWVNVYLIGVGKRKVIFSEETEIYNKIFTFTLDAGQATKSLFNSFGVNISAQNTFRDEGYIHNTVPSLAKYKKDEFIGKMKDFVTFLLNPSKILNEYLFNIKFTNNDTSIIIHKILKRICIYDKLINIYFNEFKKLMIEFFIYSINTLIGVNILNKEMLEEFELKSLFSVFNNKFIDNFNINLNFNEKNYMNLLSVSSEIENKDDDYFDEPPYLIDREEWDTFAEFLNLFLILTDGIIFLVWVIITVLVAGGATIDIEPLTKIGLTLTTGVAAALLALISIALLLDIMGYIYFYADHIEDLKDSLGYDGIITFFDVESECEKYTSAPIQEIELIICCLMPFLAFSTGILPNLIWEIIPVVGFAIGWLINFADGLNIATDAFYWYQKYYGGVIPSEWRGG